MRVFAGILSTSTTQAVGVQVIQFNNDWISSTGGGPVMWFGNVNATVQLYRTRITNAALEGGESLLVVANRSQASLDYSSYENDLPIFPNSSLSPARVEFDIQESVINGDIASLLGSYIKWSLAASSVWHGSTLLVDAVNAASAIDIDIAPDCTWVLTQNAVLQGFYAPGEISQM